MTDTQAALPLLLADTPAKAEEDLLGFQPHADRLAAMLLKQQFPDASFVVGIEGEWGEGKSTFINCLKQRFARPKQDQGEILPDVVEFNPWWFENPEKTASNLLETIINGRDQNDKEAIKALEALSAALNHITPWLEKLASNPLVLTALFGANALFTTKNAPWLGALVAAGLALALYIGTQWLSRHRVRSASLAGLKDKAAAALSSEKMEGQKQIVIIDDLDRLSHQEIREVFRAVKGVLDLPNIVYVIAYDRAIVASALDEVHKGRGEAYLEKIVQLPYCLPKPTYRKWRNYSLDMLTKTGLFRQGTRRHDDRNHSFQMINEAFLALPRDAKRLLASVHVYQLIPEQIRIDPLDFLFLEALRLKDRRLWEQLLSAILSVSNLIFMPRGDKSAEELFATWLQTYIPRLEENKPAVRAAIQYFTGWQVFEGSVLGRAVSAQRLSILSKWEKHHPRISGRWSYEIDVLQDMIRAYWQSQPSEVQFSNEDIERFLQIKSLSALTKAMHNPRMSPVFLYEVTGFLWHRPNFVFDPVRHASLVAEYLEESGWETIELLDYLLNFLGYIYEKDTIGYHKVLNGKARAMVTNWLVKGLAPKIAMWIGFSQPGDWSAFKNLAVDKCLVMSLQDLLVMPHPVVTARILDAMGMSDEQQLAVWENCLPDALSDDEARILQLMFSADSESERLLTGCCWLIQSVRFTNLVRQLPRPESGPAPWDAFLQKATV